jgi:hypothetical protein
MRRARILAVLLLPATLIVAAGPRPKATFPHEFHYLELEIDCVTCHHETDAAELVVPHKEIFENSADSWARCSSCHRRTAEPAEPQACGNCHHDSPTDVADETLSAKVVIHRSCWSCHDVGTGQPASRACIQCHVRPPGDTP